VFIGRPHEYSTLKECLLVGHMNTAH